MTDLDFGGMRWLQIHLPSDPSRSVLLEKPGAPGMSEETAAQVRELLTKGATGGHLFFQTDDAHKTHAELKERGVELPEEPITHPYGIDYGVRDPFGNPLRVAQMTPPSAGAGPPAVSRRARADGGWGPAPPRAAPRG